MRICRIKYTVLGLLVYYLQCAFTWSCASDFEDVASKTVTADVVFEGIPLNKMRLKNKPGYYYYRFALVSLIKGNFSKAYISSLQHLTKSSTLSTSATRRSSVFHSLENSRLNHDSWSHSRVRHAQSNHQHSLNTYRLKNARFDYRHVRSYRRKSKRSVRKPKKKRRIVLVRQFGAREEVSECVASQRMKRIKHLVFLKLPRRSLAAQTTFGRARTTQDFRRSRKLRNRSNAKHRLRLKRSLRSKNNRNNWQNLPNRITTNRIKKRKRKNGTPKIYSISSMPVVSTETLRKIARNHNCPKCKRQAKVVDISAARSVVLGSKVTISCTVSGFPKPEVYWLKNGLVLTDDNVVIKPRRRSISTMTSSLVFQHVKGSDTGQYQCYGVNVVGESPLVKTNITVVSAAYKPFSELCEDQTYCFYQGVCYRLIDMNKMFCMCAENFIGERCKELNTGNHVMLLGRRKRRKRSPLLQHHSNR